MPTNTSNWFCFVSTYCKKCFKIERLAKITQATLKRIMVGSVFSVDDHIRAKLDIIANI